MKKRTQTKIVLIIMVKLQNNYVFMVVNYKILVLFIFFVVLLLRNIKIEIWQPTRVPLVKLQYVLDSSQKDVYLEETFLSMYFTYAV